MSDKAFGEKATINEKDLKRSVGEWIEEASLDPVTVASYGVLQDAHPIEIITQLGIDHTEVGQFAFSIVQMEKLIRDKRIHKNSPSPYQTSNAFFVKRIDKTIRLITMSYGTYTQSRSYTMRSVPHNDYEGKCWSVKKNSTLFLNIPKDDMSIPHMPSKQS